MIHLYLVLFFHFLWKIIKFKNNTFSCFTHQIINGVDKKKKKKRKEILFTRQLLLLFSHNCFVRSCECSTAVRDDYVDNGVCEAIATRRDVPNVALLAVELRAPVIASVDFFISSRDGDV